MSPDIFIFVALACEAKALVKHWHLKKHHQEPFVIFKDETRVVVITGIGKVAMAGAVAYTMALFSGQKQPILLNLGIAGHPSYHLGDLYLADKISNAETGKRFYPQLTVVSLRNTAPVLTVANPLADYSVDCLYDMEAAGFFEIATKFSSSELIHCLKVISDNASSGIENISEDLVNQWLSKHLATIERVLISLHGSRQHLTLVDNHLFNELSTAYHFTASGAIRLRKLVQNWQLLNPDTDLCWQSSNSKSAKDLLKWFEIQLESNDFYL